MGDPRRRAAAAIAVAMAATGCGVWPFAEHPNCIRGDRDRPPEGREVVVAEGEAGTQSWQLRWTFNDDCVSGCALLVVTPTADVPTGGSCAPSSLGLVELGTYPFADEPGRWLLYGQAPLETASVRITPTAGIAEAVPLDVNADVSVWFTEVDGEDGDEVLLEALDADGAVIDTGGALLLRDVYPPDLPATTGPTG